MLKKEPHWKNLQHVPLFLLISQTSGNMGDTQGTCVSGIYFMPLISIAIGNSLSIYSLFHILMSVPYYMITRFNGFSAEGLMDTYG